ncbi:MAG TPA: CopG family antitoxin [Verrucomicrobiae bacterium]|jgi:predicted DNA binding CopG/RHH family protein
MKHIKRVVPKMTAKDETGSDISKSVSAVFPRLKPSRRPVTLRVPEIILDKIMAVANRRGTRYQSMMNEWLAEKADAEFRRAA